MGGYSDAIDREVAWLTDDLTGLTVPIAPLAKNQGGPFHLIKSYGRNPKAKVPGRTLFVSRERVTEVRRALQQKQHVHQMRLRIDWPVQDTSIETDLAGLDAALELLLIRIRGPLGDKSHGGRFLSVAEGEDDGRPEIQVEYDDPETTAENGRSIVTVRYLAGDLFFIA